MTGALTFDTGALIAVERGRDRMLRVLAAAYASGAHIIVPAAVVVEWWRGGSKTRERMMKALTVEPTDERIARVAGEALAAVQGATAIDAIVMASAALRGGVVYTSDMDDLTRLTQHFPGVRLLGV